MRKSKSVPRGGFGELKEIRGGSRELRDIMSDPAADT